MFRLCASISLHTGADRIGHKSARGAMGRNWHELQDMLNLVFGIQILGLGCQG